MMQDIKKLMEISDRSDAISAKVKISLLEFDVAVQANDPKKQEEIRVMIHQLTDDQLDLQVEVKFLKDEYTEDLISRMRNQFKDK